MWRWHDNYAQPLFGADGVYLGHVGVTIDNTDAIEAEVAWRESEARLAVELADTKQLQFVSSQLVQKENIDALYGQILEAAIALMRSEMGSMQLLHPDRNELQLLAWKGFDPASATFWEWVRVDSDSTCGVALRTGERSIVPDVETCEFMAGSGDLDAYRRSGVRAVQTTPLVSRSGRVVGMISTHWQEPHQPSERELGLLDVLARQAADLIEQQQAETALRENEKRMHGQKEAFQAAVNGAPLADSLAILTRLVAEETAGEARTAFYIANAEGTSLHPVYGAGSMPDAYLDQVNGFAIGEDSLACGLAIPMGRPVLTRDVHEEPLWKPWLQMAQAFDYRGCWSIPIVTRDDQKGVGTFAMYFRQPRQAMPGDLALAEIVTQSAAVIINSHFEAQERNRAEAALRESEAKYRSLFESIDEGFCLIEVLFDSTDRPFDYRFIEVNPVFEQQSGLANAVGNTILELVPNLEPQWIEFYGQVAKSGEAVRFEADVTSMNRVFDIYAFPSGALGQHLVAVLFADITDRKRDEERQAFLLQLSDALRPLSDAVEIQATVTRTTMNFFGADRCYYCEIIDGSAIIRRDASQADLPSVVGAYPLESSPIFRAMLDAGQPFVVQDAHTTDRLDENLRQTCLQLQIISFINVPVIKQGEPVGILAITQGTSRNWTESEMKLAEEIADRTWATIERTRAEAALSESEAKYRSLFESINDAFALLEVLYDDDNRPVDCRFLEVSPSFESQTGLPQAQGKTLRELIPSVEPGWFEHYHQALVTNDLVHFEMYQEYLNIWFEVDVLPYGNPQDRQVIIVFRNINDRKQAQANQIQLIREQSAREQERQRAETLAELDRAKTRFFSNVSHEFRTPLTLSLAPLQDALSDRTHPLDPVHQERLELVHRNSLRLLKLVNTLLDFSRIEAGRMEAVYEPTDLATYTTELTSVFRAAIERAGLQLIVNCPPLPEPVFVDREIWEKIVLNLLSNAFKFTVLGEIRVSSRAEGRGQRAEAILEICDTGTGIAPEHLPHLFERFYQVRGAQARTHEGSGIGLALVHELVRLHGGTIEVSSTVGQGTCFAIAIPFGTEHLPKDRLRLVVGDRITATRTLASTAIGTAAYVEEASRWLPAFGGSVEFVGAGEAANTGIKQTIEQQNPPLESSELKENSSIQNSTLNTQNSKLKKNSFLKTQNSHILFVDDNADIRDYLTRILSEYVQVEAVADGAAAQAAAFDRVPDLVLTDVMMPGLDGFELLQALRADPRTREVPVILLSARAGVEAVIEGLEAGADDYLIKPFSAQELVSRVNAHLQMAQLRKEALHQERTINRRKDELLSTVSHELNTPLVAILGWTRLLRANPPSQAMLVKALETIERNATLQAKLIQDLLDITRISAGKLRLKLEPVELQSVIEMAIATVAQTAQAKAIDLVWQETSTDRDTDSVIVRGDRDRLQQLICNLLTNAIKFTPKTGSITVELSVSSAENSSSKSNAEIRVIDTGIGISAEFIPHVFDRFRQARDSDSAKGLGLGLAIAQHLVELHNGTIHAQSAGVGQGATFIVRLPLLESFEF